MSEIGKGDFRLLFSEIQMKELDELCSAYDSATSSLKAVIRKEPYINIVLKNMPENDQKNVRNMARRGWLKHIKVLDKELAKLGEP
jgi:hypothetical protein